jgi:NAD+ kinase
MRIHTVVRPKAEKYGQALHRLYGQCSAETCDVIVVLGGDGAMLHAVQSYLIYQKPFYGLHFGSYGALMNPPYDPEQLMDRLVQAYPYVFHPLAFTAETHMGEVMKGHAINEIALQRSTYHVIKWDTYVEDSIMLPLAWGDGMMVSTPLGSRAYNASAKGPVLSVQVPALVLTPLCVCHPQGWPSHVIPESSSVTWRVHDPVHRPASLGADVLAFQDIVKAKVYMDFSCSITFLYDVKR